jgi:hypothetical protein
MAVGALAVTSIGYGRAHHLRDLGPSTAQTLSFLSNELFLVVIAGGFLFDLPAGLAILRGAQSKDMAERIRAGKLLDGAEPAV